MKSSEQEKKYFINPFTNLKDIRKYGSLTIEKGRGIYVYDENNNKYIEGLAGLWCVALGFNNKRLIKAANKQLNLLPNYHSFTGKVPLTTLKLSEELVKISPKSLTKVLYANSGSESNDTAIKMAWYYQNALGRTKKKKIISRYRGYHGVTIMSGSLTGMEYAHKGFDMPRDFVVHTDSPHYYKDSLSQESSREFVNRLLKNLENLIIKEGADNIAAMILEPIQGAGGVIIPPDNYLKGVQKLLKKNAILLIVDEVICGFGRTGNMFGCDTFQIKPDMMVIAKGLSSGYVPISALLINEEIYETISDFSSINNVFGHGYTYSGHPVAAAVALETIKIFKDENIIGHVKEISEKFNTKIEQLNVHSIIGNARSIGLIGAIELVQNKKNKTYFDPKIGIGSRIVKNAQKNGLIVRALQGDIVALCPPLIINNKEVDILFNKFNKSIKDTEVELNTERLM
jgi:4-aminobutyrate--pyruvate transaminase